MHTLNVFLSRLLYPASPYTLHTPGGRAKLHTQMTAWSWEGRMVCSEEGICGCALREASKVKSRQSSTLVRGGERRGILPLSGAVCPV